MIIKTDDYIVEANELNICKLIGTMRLPSPLSYDHPFSPVRKGIEEATDLYEIDVTRLDYLNSSGITALARMIILGRKEDKAIRLKICNDIPWQKRSLMSLKSLWEKLFIVSI